MSPTHQLRFLFCVNLVDSVPMAVLMFFYKWLWQNLTGFLRKLELPFALDIIFQYPSEVWFNFLEFNTIFTVPAGSYNFIHNNKFYMYQLLFCYTGNSKLNSFSRISIPVKSSDTDNDKVSPKSRILLLFCVDITRQ